MNVNLFALPNGDYLDYGRHWRLFGKKGSGPALYYSGEAAEVMRLLLKYSNRSTDEERR